MIENKENKILNAEIEVGLNTVTVIVDTTKGIAKIDGNIPLFYVDYFSSEIKRILDTVAWNIDNNQDLDTNL